MSADDDQPETLVGLLSRRDDHAALIDPVSDIAMSHAQLHAEVTSVAAQLSDLGVGVGSRVAISLANSPRLVVAFLAIASLGAAVAPLNPALSDREMRAEIDDLRVDLVLHGEPASAAATSAAATVGIDCRLLSNAPGGHVVVEGAAAAAAAAAVSHDAASVALLLHTSGTTGRPKTVPLRQRHLAYSVRNVISSYQLGPDDVSYCVMPLFHIHGLVAATLAALAAGGTVVVPQRFSASTFWDDVRRFEVTWYTAVPTIHHVVVATCDDGRHVGHGLRFVRSCSSTLPPPLWRRFEAVVGVPLVEAYGMTEAAHQMTSNPLPPGERRAGSVGLPTGIEVGVLDEHWKPAAVGETGEVSVRGHSVVDGYLDNPEANAASFRDGWFRTGDVGAISADGYLTLVGRIKELINRGGEKISPYEVEAVLLEHPAVSEAAVYPVPDDKYGEQVAAVVVTTSTVTSEELIGHCAEQLAAFKVPVSVSIRPEIPKGPTGKVQRRGLASLVNS